LIYDHVSDPITNIDSEELSLSVNEKTDTKSQLIESESITAAYDAEIEAFLSSLPGSLSFDKGQELLVGRRARLFERSSRHAGYSTTRQFPSRSPAPEERHRRNLHYFCMLEDERRSLMLLPDELRNVTRKYHTRDKYDHVCDEANQETNDILKIFLFSLFLA
jgi:hypothetical protein